MATITATRRLEFDAGHRLLKHGGKCRHYHGHRYVVEVTVTADVLDEVGVVLDFSAIKGLCGAWLDENLDHGMILQRGDPMIPILTDNGMRVFIMEASPTAENLCILLLGEFRRLMPNVSIERLRIYETPNCYAEWVAT